MTQQLDATPKDRLVFAHLLRGLASIVVLFSHFMGAFWSRPEAVSELLKIPALPVALPQYLAPLHAFKSFDYGSFGVALFFLISGFVIPFSFRHFSIRGFFVARLFRILPTYWLALAASLIALALLHASFEPATAYPHGFRSIILQALLLRGWAWIPSIDGISWTLEIEAIFYVLMGGLAYRLTNGKKALNTLIFYGACILCFCLVATPLHARALHLFKSTILYLGFSLPFIAYMLIGTVLHLCLMKKIDRTSGLLAGIFLLGVFLAGLRACPSLASVTPSAYLLALGLFLSLYALREETPYFPWLGWLADVSYPLYAIHPIVGYGLLYVATRHGVSPIFSIPVVTGVIFGLAWLLHRFMELPSMQLGKKLARRLTKSKA